MKITLKPLKSALTNNTWINIAMNAVVLYDIGVLFLHDW